MVPEKQQAKKIGVKGSEVQGLEFKVQGFVKLVLFVLLVELVGLNRTN
jgi:hypothetical protein